MNGSSRFRAALPYAGIAVALAIVVAFVDPRGDFPLDDDWNFALTTWKFAETGTFVYSRFTAMTLKAQVLWGALWTLLFGKSFEILRASSLVLFGATVLVLYGWLRKLELPRPAVWIGTLAFAFHPLVFWSAFTYMTQIPFLFFSVVALRAYHKGLTEKMPGWLVLGIAAVAGAFFVRQTGIVLAVAPLVAMWRRRNDEPGYRRAEWFLAAAPFGLFAFLFAFTSALRGYPGQILEHFKVWQVPAAELPARVAQIVGYYGFMNFQNGALFFAPLALPLAFGAWRLRDRWRWVALVPVVAFALAGFHMIDRGFPMPYWSLFARFDVHPGNVLVNFGLGPQTLPDIWVWNMSPPFPMSPEASYTLTLVSAILGGVVCWALVHAWRLAKDGMSASQSLASDMCVAQACCATAALFVSGIYFDRYAVDSLWTLAVLLPLLVDWGRWSSRGLAVAAIVLIGAFTVLATQEYLRWNRARWAAFHELRARGVRLEQLDGGYEVNQYLIGSFNGPVRLEKYGFSVVDNEYVLAFSRVRGYKVESVHSFESFLGMRSGTVLTLHRVREERSE